jgi:hydroxymethylglutaryl-CoA lyase
LRWPERVLVREVGPRDGLQNEKAILPAETKITLIRRLIRAGITAIEATSFVHPRAVPQLSDAETVLEGIGDPGPGVTISALVGNVRGMQRAIAASHTCLREIVVVVSASEAHNRANLNRTVGDSLTELGEIRRLAGERFKVRGAIATAFGCPYQGKISFAEVARVAEGMLAEGIDEITLADTAAAGNPRQVYELVRETVSRYPEVTWALHLHETRGPGPVNAVMGIMAGVHVLESSVGGLGGCPFIPGATGNISTEELVRMLHGMGIETGIDLRLLLQCAEYIKELL